MKVFFVKLQSDQKQCIIGNVYRYANQNFYEFKSFLSKFVFLLKDISNCNPHVTLLLGDYNLRYTKWQCHDVTITKRTQLETITTIYGLQQTLLSIIKKCPSLL